MAAMQAAAAAATADGGLGTVDAEQARLQAEAQALVARTDAWLAEYQRATSPIAPARPSGCKPLCDLLVAPLGHTPVSPQPGERFRTYYNAGARPVAVRTIANVPGVPVHEVQYLHPDHLGSIGQITSQTGAWVQDVYFHPYGGIRWSQSGGNAISPTSSTRRTYTGQYDIGFWAGAIQHYNARQYDYVLGRFLQPDSMVPGVYEVQDLDRFAYVRNNPIRYSDSTGHCIDPLSGTACLIILGVGTVAVVATVALVMYYSSPAASEGLQTVPRLVDGAVLTASDAVGPTPFIVAGILFLETAKIAEDAQSSFEAATNSISALLAKKRDIRDFEHILDQLGMVDRAIRRRLHDEISREGLSLEEIRRIAEDLLKQIADNKRDDGADENEPDDEEPNDE
jgi:RHS repeat-associated protein